jgi:hypothetical protein
VRGISDGKKPTDLSVPPLTKVVKPGVIKLKEHRHVNELVGRKKWRSLSF